MNEMIGAAAAHPESESTVVLTLRNPVPASRDMIYDDLVLWTEEVYSNEPGPRGKREWLGKRSVKARVERGFILEDAATHLVHLRVIASTGHEPLQPDDRISRTVAKLRKVGIRREAWVDDVQRRIAQREAMKNESMSSFRSRQLEALVLRPSQPVDCTRATTLPKALRRQHRKLKKAPR